MHVLFCGGGTAGHVEPALAIAELLKKHRPEVSSRFVLREGGRENRRVEEAGYPIHYLNVRGFDRRLSPRQLETLRLAMRAVREMKGRLREDPPALVVGTGGYVCLPVIYAATALHIPTVLHESNATPGLAVRLMAGRVDKLLFNLPGSEHTLRTRTYRATVGMPVRSDIGRIDRQTARRQLGLRVGQVLIVSFGGSLGAEAINRHCIKLMHDFSRYVPGIRHIHGCGHRYYDAVREEYPMLCYEGRTTVKPYLTDMPRLLAAADIVIARSGAATIAELCAAGAASILIPSPNVAGNHQYKNAKRLEDKGACLLLEEKELTYRRLEDAVRTLLDDTAARRRMQTAAHSLFDPACERKILHELDEFLL